ncbi:MAG: hypothetical protein Q9208_000156 [Pyrenodesmia sp. 3 TL-2023]
MASSSSPEAEPPLDLTEAIKVGDLALAQSLYAGLIAADPESGPNILSRMAILSARHAHPDILSYCFSRGLVLNTSAVNDPLIYAANDAASIPVFEVLINEGKWDVNQYLELEGDALTSVVHKGNVHIAEYLLRRGADPNSDYPFGEYTSLLWAIVGHANQGSTVEKMLKLLLDHGASVKGAGGLIAAAEVGNVKAVKMILELSREEVGEYGASDGRKLDDMGTALYKSAAAGRVEIVDVLMKRGANREFRDRKGSSVADIAKENGREDVLKRLDEQ